MNADEQTLLFRFLQDLASARAGTKDGEADAMIHQTLSANPDAAYLLVQHAIVSDQSLHAAQQRISQLESQQAAPSTAPTQSSFLPRGNAGPWSAAQGEPYAPPPPDQRPGIFSSGGGLGSFLRTAGTTAAGVAGGEMLFSGLSDLFGHHGGGGMFGGEQGFMGSPDEVIVNNYGDDDRDDDRGDDY